MKIAKKKLLLGAAIISSVAALASCGKTETAKELRIIDKCNTSNDLCEFELTDAVVSRYTNALGKTIERVESKTPLRDSDIKGTITWHAPDTAVLADNKTVVDVLQVNCENDNCTANSNPTAYSLPVGSNTISVSGTVTVDGKEVDLATDVKPDVIDTQAVDNSHVFKTGTLPSGATITTLVAALNENSGTANGKFSSSGNALMITCNTGFKWLDSIDPDYGSYVSNPGHGASRVFWDLSKAEFTEKQGVDNSATTQNAAGGNNGATWEIGCWEDK
ncbi:DUF3281 family protein [Francisella hispaniensis]|uniref:Lipoprotein n=1 Tax=Francisella hispaniensis TaxID=622488 RepID=F4BKD4_9GAMM|nr:DUF3281 family protein [Francisella hispaniensis]AEB28628.1 hypothetical protein FN3523_0771 [Francisella hispaniensis]